MTPREELIEIINRPGVVHHFMAQADVERLADAILAAGYRKVGAGRDARETARTIHAEMGRCDSYDESLHVLAAAITAAVEAQRERDAKIVDEYKRDDPEYAICAGYRLHLAAAIREGRDMPPTKPWRSSPARWNAVCERFARSYWMRRIGCAAFTLAALAVTAQIVEAVTASTSHPPRA